MLRNTLQLRNAPEKSRVMEQEQETRGEDCPEVEVGGRGILTDGGETEGMSGRKDSLAGVGESD